ncbi:Phosphoacetylglucosamine mutase [Aphelenchoides besseyi]|nr:Phosphoacetylglucosamine mutase [Aphelenchoides besseyi]
MSTNGLKELQNGSAQTDVQIPKTEKSTSSSNLIPKPVPFSAALQVPPEYTRAQNRNHLLVNCPIASNLRFVYGTAGFRTKDDYMTFIAYRTGVFAGYRARKLGKNIGLMITASHNLCNDNGIKIVDPMGEMLDQRFETPLTDLINKSDEEFLHEVTQMESSADKAIANVCVHIAWDTRQSSLYLAVAAGNGIGQTGIKSAAHNYLTTPQLHYLVRVSNDPAYGPRHPIEKRFVDAVFQFRDHTHNHNNINYTSEVFVDCANGVGAERIHGYTDPLGAQIIDLGVVNIDIRSYKKLNNACGADFVKLNCKLPMDFEDDVEPGTRCVSLDGDADRLVYFYLDKKEPRAFHLLDGDYIAALFAKFLIKHLDELKLLNKMDGVQQCDKFTFAVIQTAYSNGNSTRFFEKTLKCKVVMTNTGIKNLHNAAQKFDVAVYFEANGHGTVTFSPAFYQRIRQMREDQPENPFVGRLDAFTRIINECVGDAIADFLAVEQLLWYYDWNAELWWKRTFTAAPTVQLKIPVENRSFYKSSEENETKLIKPEGMQKSIDKIVKKYKKARAFVRPSGTEDVLRVYAEADTKSDAESLANELKNLFPR